MDFENYIYSRCKSIIEGWNEKDIYSVSFFVYFNDADNSFEFSVGYNTEAYCENAGKFSEERWNFAFWSHNNIPVIADEDEDSVKMLRRWFAEKGIDNVGEPCGCEYDSEMNYIGKGPSGYYELLTLVSDTARKLQSDGTVKNRLGSVPVIVHDLEYTWYVKEATLNANPNGEAADFIQAFDRQFC